MITWLFISLGINILWQCSYYLCHFIFMYKFMCTLWMILLLFISLHINVSWWCSLVTYIVFFYFIWICIQLYNEKYIIILHCSPKEKALNMHWWSNCIFIFIAAGMWTTTLFMYFDFIEPDLELMVLSLTLKLLLMVKADNSNSHR